MVKSAPYDLDDVFQALAHPARRDLIRQLGRGERTVGDLARTHAVSLVAVSKHLKVLERARLVRRRVAGSSHYLRLNPEAMASADRWLRRYESFWHDPVGRSIPAGTWPRRSSPPVSPG